MWKSVRAVEPRPYGFFDVSEGGTCDLTLMCIAISA